MLNIAETYIKRVLNTVPTTFITVKRIPGGGIQLTPKKLKAEEKPQKHKL